MNCPANSDRPHYSKLAIVEGPAWLKIDPATGMLSGTPAAAGKVDVAVTVTID